MMDERRTKKSKTRGPFSSLRRMMGDIISTRAFLAVFSAVFALVVWAAFVSSDGTLTRQKTFKGVTLSVNGESALLSRGYIVTDVLSETLPAVDMTVEVSQTNYDRASAVAYNPHIELSQIKGEGENELTIQASSIYGPVVECKPATVKVNVERYLTKRVPVVVVLTGEMPEGLYVTGYDPDPSVLTVSGPASLVSQITRVAVPLDQSSFSRELMHDRISLGFELQNNNEEAIVSDKINVNYQSVVMRSVIVETALVPMKQVPIDTSALTQGEPAEGYELIEAWTEEDSVAVAAEQELLDAITIIQVDTPLDITGATGTVQGYLRLKGQSAIKNRIPSQMGVTALIEEKQIERTIRNVPLLVQGAEDGTQVSLSQSRQTVQLSGGYHFIKNLEADDLQVYVDVSGLAPGQYKVPVQVRIDNAEAFGCALSSPEVTVTIR